MLLLDDGIWLVGFVELVLEVLEVLSGTRSELIPYVLKVSAISCHSLCSLPPFEPLPLFTTGGEKKKREKKNKKESEKAGSGK